MTLPVPLWLHTACTDPYRNLAREELLLEAVQPGELILYLWRNCHTVVIGRNQDSQRECDIAALEACGGRLARRLSGGGAVYHDLGNLNFTFLATQECYDVSRQLSVITEACRLLGIQTEVSGRNDLTAGGRKFSGNAFYASGGRCYHHGTLLLHTDISIMGRFLHVSQDKLARKGVPSVHARVTNLCAFCPGLTVGQMSDMLIEALGTVYGAAAQPFPEGRLDEDAVKGRASFYASDSWRFGRKRPTGLHFSTRFEWGDFQLYARLCEGCLRDVHIFSDAMDSDYISRLPKALENIPFSASEMARAIRRAGQGGNEEISLSIAGWLMEELCAETAGAMPKR